MLDLRLLKNVLSTPTAPFFEDGVADFITKYTSSLGLTARRDRIGNLWVNYPNLGTRNKYMSPGDVIFTAHMDHPALHVYPSKNGVAKFEVMGGLYPPYLKGRRVEVFITEERVTQVGGPPMAHSPACGGRAPAGVTGGRTRSFMGKILSIKKRGRRVTGRIRLNSGDTYPFFRGTKNGYVSPEKWFAQVDVPRFKIQGSRVMTIAADDLANVAVLLNLLKTLSRTRSKKRITCVFTVAEEVGFIGLLYMMKKGFFPKDTPVIVLESSSAKAGKVAIGGGPVLRVADKQSSFHPEVDAWLLSVARKMRGFKFQRALLPGGTCEASLLALKGHHSSCLALPLGNYHNRGDGRFAPEFIDRRDLNRMLRLLIELTRHAPNGFQTKALFKKLDRNYTKLLKLKI